MSPKLGKEVIAASDFVKVVVATNFAIF